VRVEQEFHDRGLAQEVIYSVDVFDLESFFESDTQTESIDGTAVVEQPASQFLLELKNEAQETVVTLTSSITAESFRAGATLTSGFFSGFSVDNQGNYHLTGGIDSLSRATGLSKSSLLAGKYSAQDVLLNFFSCFGESVFCVCGLGLIDCILDGLAPEPEAA